MTVPMSRFALKARSFDTYQTGWSFTWRDVNGGNAHQPERMLLPNEVYVLDSAPTTGYLDVWVYGYLVGDIVYSGWKVLFSRKYVTFQDINMVYSIDLVSQAVAALQPLPTPLEEEVVATPLAKATAISWGLVLLIALGIIALSKRKGGK